MSTLATAASVGAVVVLTLLSAFFSSSETAVFSLSDETAAEIGGTRGERLRELRADPHRLLVTLLVGNNVVNVAIATLTTALLVDRLPEGLGVLVATGVVSVLVLIVGEIVPKSYGLGNAREWAGTVAGPISLVERLLYPLVVVFDLVTRRIGAVLGGAGVETAYEEGDGDAAVSGGDESGGS
ncbi:CNNM domain-containing protein [Halobaculum sp. MBLA0147]|uniref:CNNM domain-containing protein n=1 Tax=Halobaculum sp. MBLA0147 TaxID=3079934 RepID=UPI00352424E3